ncbi:MAG: TIR domain-containing protein, partial [Planctomycetota bacterium]
FVQPVEYPALLVALRTPGRGVVIEGPSGIGKTTSITRALSELGLADKVVALSARKPADLDLIRELPSITDFGTVIIDDFHRLQDATKQSIANLMKVLADEERPNSKVVILGINKAGEALIQLAHDLNNRLEVITFEANPIEKVQQLIALGEKALNVDINVKAEIAEAANGSFYIAQMLSHQTCLDSGILVRQEERLVTKVSFELTRGKVFERLSRTFLKRTQKFARGTRFRREGRAPYLHLLYWLAKCDDWSLSVNRAIRENQALSGSVTQIVEKGYLLNLVRGDDEIAAVLHYDPKSRELTVEDPQFVYFLRNISWSRFAADAGFLTMDFPSRYDFALSFAGPDRSVAEALFRCLQEREFETFYDRNEQHRILAEDVEDYLRPIYQADAEYVVVLLGPEYPKRVWTRFESEQFRNRFKSGAVIPVWFVNAPPGMFDETSPVGGISFDPAADINAQVQEIAEVLARKIEEKRTGRPVV